MKTSIYFDVNDTNSKPDWSYELASKFDSLTDQEIYEFLIELKKRRNLKFCENKR